MTTLASIGDLPLRHGGLLRDVQLAYVTHGSLAPDGRNAILLTHGYTSSHLFAEGGAASEGTWAALVGPGRTIDTDRYFVVASNMLGSSYGSTGPASLAPTGRPYGPDFPPITLADIVAAQRRLLDHLGVRELVAVIGPSYGGFQAFTWGVEHPDFVRALAPVTSAPRAISGISVDALRTRLAADPRWNGGRYEPGAMVETMTQLREATLRRYGMDAVLARRHADPAERAAALHADALRWAQVFDPHSMIVLGAAANELDTVPQFPQLRARVLYILATTDILFPPALAPEVMAALRGAGVDATYLELDTPYGHMSPGIEAATWAPALQQLLASVA